jgi:poly-gamma-glutamate capsule biosynthesis protein CapA/YwtB (metallophosphatase superfamily)
MHRRRFLAGVGCTLLGPSPLGAAQRGPVVQPANAAMPVADATTGATTLFVCGDVMTGRGIDQILPHPGNPQLYESFVRSALRYVQIAEDETGPVPRPVGVDYVWGDALAELERVRPQARIVNLETAITTAESAWPDKGIHYRMHPANVGCLTAAAIDCCSVANNHVLDWGYGGLSETLATLRAAGIRAAGAGADEAEATAPAVVELAGGRRVLVFACAMASAGVPREWAATTSRAGVSYLEGLAPATADAIAARVAAVRRNGDIVVLSIHWGGNWGYEVSRAQRSFARELVEHAGVDLVHGHSSHHPKGIEIHHDRPIIYGCGDFLNDYEGIGGHERFNGELGLMYFPSFDPAGALDRLALVPTRIRHLRVNRARGSDVEGLAAMLTREGEPFGTRVEREPDDTLLIHRR